MTHLKNVLSWKCRSVLGNKTVIGAFWLFAGYLRGGLSTREDYPQGGTIYKGGLSAGGTI